MYSSLRFVCCCFFKVFRLSRCMLSTCICPKKMLGRLILSSVHVNSNTWMFLLSLIHFSRWKAWLQSNAISWDTCTCCNNQFLDAEQTGRERAAASLWLPHPSTHGTGRPGLGSSLFLKILRLLICILSTARKLHNIPHFSVNIRGTPWQPS